MENILSLPLTKPNPIKVFFDTCANILFSPTKFFREQFSRLETAELITLGLLSGWIASFVALFWSAMNDLVLQSLLQNWMRSLMATEEGFNLFSYSGNDFLYDVGLTLLFPFWALVRIFFSTTMLWIFARLLISRQERNHEINFTSCLRIVSVASVGRWFCVVPVLGPFIALLAVVVLMVTGVHQHFQVSYRRAGFIVLLPTVAILCVILFTLVFMGFILALEMPELLSVLS